MGNTGCAGRLCKQALHFHIHSQADDCFIIINPVVKSYLFRKAGSTCAACDLNYINLSLFMDQITVYRTVIQPYCLNGCLNLLLCLKFQCLSTFEWNGMAYRSRHCTDKALRIIDHAVNQLSVLHHGFCAEKCSFYEFLYQAILLSGSFHGLLIIIQSFLSGIAAENPPASHQVHSLDHHREIQLIQCMNQFFPVMDTDMSGCLHPCFPECFLHLIFIGRSSGCFF